MSAETPWDAIPNVMAGLVFLVSGAFIVIYGTRSNWRETAPGQALMFWVASFATLIAMNTVHLATGRYPGITAVRILVYGFLLVSAIRLVWTLIDIQRNGRSIDVRALFRRKNQKE
jgi:hypothetical protein